MQYVYFIQQGRRGPVKIGITANPERRLAVLQTGSPRKLHLRRLIAAERPSETERDIHWMFRHLRLNGEWFMPGEDLEEFIRSDAELESSHDRIRRAFDGPPPTNVVSIAALQYLRDEL